MIEVLAWPFVGLVLGVVSIFAFRDALVRKIERITRATKDGISFEQPQLETKPKEEVLSFDELMRQPVSNAVLDREKFISTKFKEIQLKTEVERITILTRVLASVGVEADFYRVAHVIFGSQVALLVQLSGTQHGLTRNAAVALYEAAKKRFPEVYSNRPFEQWVGYLQSMNLVKIESEALDITQHGADFRKYLVDARLAHERHG